MLLSFPFLTYYPLHSLDRIFLLTHIIQTFKICVSSFGLEKINVCYNVISNTTSWGINSLWLSISRHDEYPLAHYKRVSLSSILPPNVCIYVHVLPARLAGLIDHQPSLLTLSFPMLLYYYYVHLFIHSFIHSFIYLFILLVTFFL